MSKGIKAMFNTGGHGKPASIGLLLARLFAGGFLFVAHGLPKALDFSKIVQTFPDPFTLTPQHSLYAVLAAEVAAALCVALGFFTRVAAVPLAVHTGISAVYLQIIKNKATLHAPELEVMCLYTGLFLLLAFAGPGRMSVDHLISK
ncbi:MAG: DoxX family protein [Myxococcales bacterium]|nr:DoxX family protein [Myxococcales bacterium]MCB9525082.1 DoxX family protein [Myxococcales bacterium]